MQILHRLPLSIVVRIETDTSSVILPTYIQMDEKENLVLVGKALNGIIDSLQPHQVLCSSIKLGNKSIDSFGRAVEEYWLRCDNQDRKGALRQDDRLIIEKSGVSFYFKLSLKADNVKLDQIVYRINILPWCITKRCLPTHLLGELANTHQGMKIIERYRLIQIFKDDIVNSNTTLIKKRAALWALGQIGSSSSGIEFIKKEDVVKEIVRIAEMSEYLSLRGTAVYSLGLLSKTEEGKGILKEQGWTSHIQKGILSCIPLSPKKFFTIIPVPYKGDMVNLCNDINKIGLSKEEEQVFYLLVRLCNQTTQKVALADIKKLNKEKANLFMDIKLFHCAHLMLINYRFKLNIRKVIHQLFDGLLTSKNFFSKYAKICV